MSSHETTFLGSVSLNVSTFNLFELSKTEQFFQKVEETAHLKTSANNILYTYMYLFFMTFT